MSLGPAFKAGELLPRNEELVLAGAVIAATAMLGTGGRVYTDDEHFRIIPGVQAVWGKS